MSLSVKSVRYFIAVAEAESITGATQTLNISQSVITEAVKSLEAELGVQLFVRHARGMELTQRGTSSCATPIKSSRPCAMRSRRCPRGRTRRRAC